MILKGGISNIRYIWHTNGDNPCELCEALDGNEYSYADEIPDQPHPNCNCYIEEIFDEESPDEGDYEAESEQQPNPNQGEDEGICEEWLAIEEMLDEADEASGDAESAKEDGEATADEAASEMSELEAFKEEVEQAKEELIDLAESKSNSNESTTTLYASISITDIYPVTIIEQEIQDLRTEMIAAWEIFNSNKAEMEAIKNAGLCTLCTDKYHHAKANCETSQRGEVATLLAVILSIGKEIDDIRRKVFINKENFFEVWQDCMRDLKADWYGIQQAKEQINCGEAVEGVCEYVFPKKKN